MEVTLGESFTISGRLRNRLGARDQLVENAGIGAKDHSSVLGIGARGVQLVGGDAGSVVERFDHRNIVPYLVTKDVGDAGGAGVRPQGGKLFLDEGLDANVLQSDGIDHAAWSLDQPRCLIARHGLLG